MLDKLLASLSQSVDVAAVSSAKKVDPDAVLARLSLASTLYDGTCPFYRGQLVTPRADGPVKGAGEPCVVVEVLDGDQDAIPLPGEAGSENRGPVILRSTTASSEDVGGNGYGRILNMRIAKFRDELCLAVMAESADFVAWTPEHEAAWRAKLAAAQASPKALSLTEAIAALRDRAAGKEVKAEWKEGDTVEIVPEPRGVEAPMSVEGLHVGIVRKVDPSDGTTSVTYHAASTGKIGTAWMRNVDLAKWGPKPAPTAGAPVEPEPAIA